MSRETGIVKWFSREKGYGFVRRESGEEVFVHHTDIDGDGFRSLQQGEAVEFEIVSSDRGPRAGRVRRVGGGAAEGEDRDAKPDRRRKGADRGRSTSGRGSGGATGKSRRGRGAERQPGPEATKARSDSSRRGAEPASGKTGLATLAEQLRARLGRRFAGFRD